jgi:single-strand DNA-binding protein
MVNVQYCTVPVDFICLQVAAVPIWLDYGSLCVGVDKRNSMRRHLIVWSSFYLASLKLCSGFGSSRGLWQPRRLQANGFGQTQISTDHPVKDDRNRKHQAKSFALFVGMPLEEEEIDDDDERLSDQELEVAMGEWDNQIACFNTVHLTGRIGNDPEPRYLEDGKVVLNLSLATARKYHSKERLAQNVNWGEEETDWYGLEIWGQTAEFVSKFVDKGSRVGVVGSLQIDEWSDRESGEIRSKAKVIVRDFDILESKYEADMRRSNQRGSSFERDEDDTASAGTGDFF